MKEQSAVEYKIAASTNTRNKGILRFVARTAETLRSIVQMRYATSPGHIQISMRPQHRPFAGVCLPELNKLVASVKVRNAVIQIISPVMKV
jgi:hypothetical protein